MRDMFVLVMFAAVPFCLPFLLSYTKLLARGLWVSLLVVALVGGAMVAFTEDGFSQSIAALVIGVLFLPGGLLGVIAGLMRRHLRKTNKWLPWKIVGGFILSAVVSVLLSISKAHSYGGPPIYITGYYGMYAMLVLTVTVFGSAISAGASALQRRKTAPPTSEEM